MTNAEIFQEMGQTLLFAAAAVLTLFFVSLFILRHTLQPWIRAFVLLLFFVLLPFAAYFLTHNHHVTMATFVGCNGGMVFAVVFQTNRMLAASEDEKDDINGR